jgi:hypothetical protein
MSYDWSKVETGGGHPFVKFANVGDSVTGVVVAIRDAKLQSDKPEVPCIDLMQDGADEPVTLTVDKADLRAQIPLLNPQVGDKLRVTYTDDRKTPNGTMKIFTVQHRPGDRTEEPQTAPPADYAEYSEEPF